MIGSLPSYEELTDTSFYLIYPVKSWDISFPITLPDFFLLIV